MQLSDISSVGLLDLFEDSALPIVKVFILCFIGAVAAHANIFDPGARKHVSVLVFNVFAPSLMTMKLASAVDLENIKSWWSLPANICLSIIIGWVLGWACAKLTRAPSSLTSMLAAVTALGNVGNLPLVLVETLGRGDSPFGHNVSDLGVAYVAFGIWVASIFQFSISYYLLAPKEKTNASYQPLPASAQENGDPPAAAANGDQPLANGASDPEAVQASLPGISTSSTGPAEPRPPSPYAASYQTSPMAPLLSSYEDPDTVQEFSESPNRRLLNMSTTSLPALLIQHGTGCCVQLRGSFAHAGQRVRRAFFKVKWSNIFTFPIKCCFAAIGIGLIPPAKALLVGPDAPLAIVKESLETMGGAMIPGMMMVLGANLSKGPPPCDLPAFNIAAVAVVRLLVAPLFGVSIVIASVHANIVRPPDSFFMFVLMLQHCMPTAINMHTVATLHQNGVAEVTTVLFWQYLASIVTLPIWMMLFLFYLRTYSPFAV
mmetsp:Transcript_39159/g.92763  ORF Transcript_39159/g.92763 Transcript_39159/m.92763 type:complete len:488 (-) Transcript_39159:211-1674(-)